MEVNDWWIDRFKDNRIRGILSELRDAIDECENENELHKVRSSLQAGFCNFAARRERELREKKTRSPFNRLR